MQNPWIFYENICNLYAQLVSEVKDTAARRAFCVNMLVGGDAMCE